MRLLPTFVYAAALLAVNATAGFSQSANGRVSPEKERVIRRILDVTRSADNMLVTMEATLPAQRASNPNIPPIFWDRFMARAREKRHVLIDSLVPLYDKHFSTAELQDILRFYETPVGKRMVAVLPDIMRESVLIGQRWGAVLGQEVATQLQREGVIPGPPDEQR